MIVNNVLMESLMMLAGITLVLVGTTHFNNEMTKYMIMGGLVLVAILSGVFRYVVAPKQEIQK